MSLQWTLIACFLYGEIAIICILLMPFISPKMWQRFFKSKFSQGLSSQGNLYFMVFIVILVLFFLDSVREMYKYTQSKQHDAEHAHLDAELQHSMRLFRAQRNFYIAGFSLFLCFVIRRLATLISAQATLLAQNEASMKQAQSATQTAEKLLKEKDLRERNAGEAAENQGNIQREEMEELQSNLKKASEKLALITEERDHAKKDVDSMTKQSANLSMEYDRLLKEHARLQSSYDQISGSESSKKEE